MQVSGSVERGRILPKEGERPRTKPRNSRVIAPTGRQHQQVVEPTSHTQFRAARALLNWTLKKVAAATGASIMSVRRAEAENLSKPSPALLKALRDAYDRAGVEFIPENGGGAGVRLRKTE